MAIPTEHLLRKVSQGDQAAFAELFNYYKTPALKFCNSILKDEEEAENVLQEIFMKIWDRRTFLKPDHNFHSYLFTCLRNLSFDYLKKIEKNHSLRQHYLERMELSRENEKDEKELRLQFLQTAIDSLSVKRKLILMLNVEQGKSYQEIAEHLNISKNTVKNQLVKAKQFLRDRAEQAAYL
ncbi:RNA polymerase sigma-70 factor [Rhabdobacter roseus]|uniref:RNA polymerase sigma-70 factor (ECF subfamily) n=1 Tax=Rhabdobacter roseus TaxID=1655419 RepID=A0A840TM99_9BACT|nr:RNA polymerase sigma-70 factor [Rhabdobacter roseus]MBB5282877.1 RNA polymerase sigma-70 factor (ECF subfamily) [Rhabdobacter roseus]